jgi:hypothetical protein
VSNNERSVNMELKSLSPELDELRNVIITSNLTSCYLIMNELALKEGETVHYETFRAEWIDTYKNVHRLVSKMKIRKSSR